MVFCVFLIEDTLGCHQQLTESKNIVPSRSYGHLKLGATLQLQYASGVAEAPADPAVQGGALRGGRHIDESDAPLTKICTFFLFVVKIE